MKRSTKIILTLSLISHVATGLLTAHYRNALQEQTMIADQSIAERQRAIDEFEECNAKNLELADVSIFAAQDKTASNNYAAIAVECDSDADCCEKNPTICDNNTY